MEDRGRKKAGLTAKEVTSEQGNEGRERNATRAAFDASYDSSPRGEHRYPDAQQSERERNARKERDALKRKLAGTG